MMYKLKSTDGRTGCGTMASVILRQLLEHVTETGAKPGFIGAITKSKASQDRLRTEFPKITVGGPEQAPEMVRKADIVVLG